MLNAILQAMRDLTVTTEQESEHLTEQVTRLMMVIDNQAYSTRELMSKLALSHRPTFLYSYLRPALDAGLIVMTLPDSPRARNQRYMLTSKGKSIEAGNVS